MNAPVNAPPPEEFVIAAPRAGARYFHELVAGGLWLVAAILTSIGMLYMVMFHGDVIALRFFYFFVIAVALGVMMLGIKLIMDSEAERALAHRVKNRDLVMDGFMMQLGIALAEGPIRALLRKAKVPALDISLKEITAADMEPQSSVEPCLVLSLSGVDSHGIITPMKVRVQRKHIAKQEEGLRDQLLAAGVSLGGDWQVVNPPSSQSDQPAPQT